LEAPKTHKASETIPPGLFYPDSYKSPNSKLQIKLVNKNLTQNPGHTLHFISADCEFSTSVSKLLLDLKKIDKTNIRNAKPKVGDVIVTPKANLLTLSGVLINKHFEEVSVINLKNVLSNAKYAIEKYNIKNLLISKQNDLTDSLTFSCYLDILKETLSECDCTLFVCYGHTNIPPEDIRDQIMKENHDSLIGGHRGVTKTYRRIREKYYWPGMKADIIEHIRACKSCQENKLVRIKNKEPMVITDTALDSFDKISIDTVGPLPLTPRGNRHILTILDNLTKYCLAVPIPNTKAETIADALARHVITVFGSPRIILSDKAPSLIGKVMQQLGKIFKIDQVTTSGYRPQTNGALERTHLALMEYIRQYIEKFDDWDLMLPFAIFSYNTRIHDSTNFTPHELVFGKPPRIPSSLPTNQVETYPSYLSELITRMNDLKTLAAESSINSKIRSKKYYDKNSRSHHYQRGDKVYVLKEPRASKLDVTYVGPFQIVSILENHNVILEDGDGKRILKHIDKIKPAY